MIACIINAINTGRVYRLPPIDQFQLYQWPTHSSSQDNSVVLLAFVNKVLLACKCTHLFMACFCASMVDKAGSPSLTLFCDFLAEKLVQSRSISLLWVDVYQRLFILSQVSKR